MSEVEITIRVKGLTTPLPEVKLILANGLVRSLYKVDADPEGFHFKITSGDTILREGPS